MTEGVEKVSKLAKRTNFIKPPSYEKFRKPRNATHKVLDRALRSNWKAARLNSVCRLKDRIDAKF